ncbi:MAG: 50S ribosomal protein L10 [Bacteroidia bacterium]|nr:50S ribosomal protein L10 [Bacteroidia bacterium]
MTKDQKVILVQELVEQFKQYPNFLITDTEGMNVAQVGMLRRAAFEANIPIRVVKNSLIVKALSQVEGDYEAAYPALKRQSAVFFTNETSFKTAAKLIKEFRSKGNTKPTLKVAFVEASSFFGDDQIDTLIKLKSKEELVGEIIGLLQSPMQNVLGALNSGGNILHGVLKTLESR